jgi:hypothetical protein
MRTSHTRSKDVTLLCSLGLPSPLALDDMLSMQQATREAALVRAVEVLAPYTALVPLDGGVSVAVKTFNNDVKEPKPF